MTKRIIYLDNAATTPLDSEVLKTMMPFLTDLYGNPSAIYSCGRQSRLAVENARKSIADILGARPSEIFFTSGATESINTVLSGAVKDLGCEFIITSDIEHLSTLNTASYLASNRDVKVLKIPLLPSAVIDLIQFEDQLKKIPNNRKFIVVLSHANSEIGTINDITTIGNIIKKYNGYFCSDTVQTLGHRKFHLKETPVDFIIGSAHKFHGPKGIGLLYVNQDISISPNLLGGSQERNMRAGTENVPGIVGMAKALQIADCNIEKNQQYLQGLREFMIEKLLKETPATGINGATDKNKILENILSVNFPRTEKSEMLLYNLDIAGVCASAGSACSSGALNESHVITFLRKNQNDKELTIRFSFSRLNTKEEIEKTIEILKTILS